MEMLPGGWWQLPFWPVPQTETLFDPSWSLEAEKSHDSEYRTVKYSVDRVRLAKMRKT